MNTHPRIPRPLRIKITSTVGTPVVDDHQFDIHRILDIEHPLHGGFQRLPLVVHRHQNRKLHSESITTALTLTAPSSSPVGTRRRSVSSPRAPSGRRRSERRRAWVRPVRGRATTGRGWHRYTPGRA